MTKPKATRPDAARPRHFTVTLANRGGRTFEVTGVPAQLRLTPDRLRNDRVTGRRGDRELAVVGSGAWRPGKARRVRSARFADWGVLRRGAQPLFFTIVDVNYEDGERESYFLPLAIRAAAEARGVEERAPNAVLARVTGARKGVLFDAWLDNGFGRALLETFDQINRGLARSSALRV